MNCPKCASTETKVVDSRSTTEPAGNIRRRRECLDCGHRFSTVEQVLREDLLVIKNNGSQEPFDRVKLMAGLAKALSKRPVNREQAQRLISETLEHLQNEFDLEIPSRAIADALMSRLRNIDTTAYIRYASKYRKFIEADQPDNAPVRQT